MVKLTATRKLAVAALAGLLIPVLAEVLLIPAQTIRAQKAEQEWFVREYERLNREREYKREYERLKREIENERLAREIEFIRLDGTWVVASATRDGKPVEDLRAGRMVFAGDRLTLRRADGTEQRFTCEVDPSRTPKALDLAPAKEEKDAAPGQAIDAVDGDVLRVCIGPPGKRPTGFADSEGSLIKLQQVRPARIWTPFKVGW